MRVAEIAEFAVKRHTIHLRREAGEPPETWTDDPILRTYRFCNVYRELDTVTQWLRKEWYSDLEGKPNTFDDLWHYAVIARHMNNVPFLEDYGYPAAGWDPARFKTVAARRARDGKKIFSGAYMIGTRHTGSKADYLADMVFQPLWDAREKLRPLPGDTLTGFHMSLCLFYGLASFMSAQVVADVKYATPALRAAADWHTFCASGPGSRRGLNRLMDLPLRQPWNEDVFRMRVLDLREALTLSFGLRGWEVPHAQDVQNLLCEWDKYERARLGEGRPKQLFRGGVREATI